MFEEDFQSLPLCLEIVAKVDGHLHLLPPSVCICELRDVLPPSRSLPGRSSSFCWPPLPLSLKPSAGFPSPVQGGERASERPRDLAAASCARARVLRTPCSKGLATLSSPLSLSLSLQAGIPVSDLRVWFSGPPGRRRPHQGRATQRKRAKSLT